MTLIRWEPSRELTSLQTEMNRLFNGFFGDTAAGPDAGTARRWAPAMDLVETGDHFVLRADLPGLEEGDVSIEVQDSVLTVSGERRSEHEDSQEGYHRVERAQGRFSRTLTLPDGVDADAIEASFERGVLEVRIPKPAERKPRRVQIGLGGKSTVEGTESDAPANGRPAEPAKA